MMQTDVKSAIAKNTGLLVTQQPVRLKSITVTSGTSSVTVSYTHLTLPTKRIV